MLENAVAEIRGSRECELQARQTVAECIRCHLARSSCTCNCLRSSSRLLVFAIPCRTPARPAWLEAKTGRRLYLEALLRLARR